MVFKIFRYCVLGILFLYLQILVAPLLDVWGVAPNLFLAFAVFCTLNLTFPAALSIIFICGIGLDLFNPMLLGTNTIFLVILTALIASYHSLVSKEKFAPVLISLLIISLFYSFYFTLIRIAILGFDTIWLMMFPLELIYNAGITIMLLTILVVLQRLRFYLDV